ncbi:AcrR family transcriptional regulator [Pseudarthrobacter sp. PvP004]|uniref:TetR family transcriptional regulator n=1 Tax=Pseudarthrobacter sp. PvP004 TaxID=2817850 RepID=UPI001AE2D662|nr:TetR family transcriptional regulator [Pseudarthrobacter sp. PvP004]MBP2266190.1 AcrR family transcriptional regulator [Pseudarthrobacter sp. PvP004]
MRDAEATRSRILAAAIEEFAEQGFAGGRVDRIARSAESNVRMIYAYFGGKSGLFDAALETALRTLATDVPPDPEDLAGWAGRVFDHHQERPDILRLSMWARLERPSALSEPVDVYSAKVEGVRAASTSALTPVDVLIFIYAIAQAWQLSPTGLTALGGAHDDPRRIRAHRRAVVSAVEGMLRDA